MSPISMAAALAQQNAEALAGIALTQLVHAEYAVVYGGFTINTHMKSGAPSFGTPEGAWAAFASTQLARHYRLPSGQWRLDNGRSCSMRRQPTKVFGICGLLSWRTATWLCTVAAGWKVG